MNALFFATVIYCSVPGVCAAHTSTEPMSLRECAAELPRIWQALPKHFTHLSSSCRNAATGYHVRYSVHPQFMLWYKPPPKP